MIVAAAREPGGTRSNLKRGFVTIAASREGRAAETVSATRLCQLIDEASGIADRFAIAPAGEGARSGNHPRCSEGFTLFFTGLSGAGKTTLAKALLKRLAILSGRPATLLDGDLVRQHLSRDLGFSREDRNRNIRRIGYVASEITKCGGIAICTPIAPYDEVRKEMRALISMHGGFVLVHISTPLEECERRDSKGLYAKARAGILPQFTGISDPYEAPADAELAIDTTAISPADAARKMLDYLKTEGYVARRNAAGQPAGDFLRGTLFAFAKATADRRGYAEVTAEPGR